MPKVPPEIFCYIHRKTLVLEPLFNKVAGFLVHSCFYVTITKFWKHLQTAVSVHALILVISFLFCNQGITEVFSWFKTRIICWELYFCFALTLSFKNRSSQHEACNFIKREALAQVFSCKFCEILRTSFFTVYL